MITLRNWFLRTSVLLAVFFVTTSTAFAQTGSAGAENLGEFLLSFIDLIDMVLVPVLIAVAFMVFVYGIFQYFILGGASEEQRDKGKQFLLWGLIGFFIMFSVWGLVNILLGTFKFGSETMPPIPQFGGATQQATGGGGGGQQDLCANVNCPSYQHCDPTNGACIPNMFPYF